jgi:hypothetical protein
MTDLNENHKKYLLIAFRYVDKLLSEFQCILDVMIPHSPFQQYVNDVDPDLRMIIEKHCALIHQAMRRILKEQGIQAGNPDRSVINFIRTSLIFADMSIEELKPRHMRGYGHLSAEAAEELNKIAAELQGLVAQIKTKLPE